MTEQIEYRINSVISSIINCPLAEIQADKHLFFELFADSLMLTDIVFTLENEFKLHIQEASLVEVNYVRDLYRIVQEGVGAWT
ncbi:phosphopantetheine-binding protein [Yersinia kristensenii]|uniref:phosphopantetheine-binding protein n=1 Tax=Yersinia kristensenii TaxID=28152 RepID=UPI0005E3BFED|nr:phosphopantetheine-binding protein [Yersinia kristensenii]CNF37925.1 putative acyl carrier protein IacP [Yersinia kristensenii]